MDFYSESEYAADTVDEEDSLTYSWNEPGFSLFDRLSFGLVTQRSMTYQSSRDIRMGRFVQGGL